MAPASKHPGGSGFWDKYWKDFDNQQFYSSRVSSLKSSLGSLMNVQLEDPASRLYADIFLDTKAKAKTNKPKDIWKSSGIEIVGSPNSLTLTVSGRREDFVQLERLLGSSTFSAAKAHSAKNETQISREVMAVSDIQDRNSQVERRIGRDLKEEMDLGDEKQVFLCLMEVYSDQNFADYDRLFDKLSQVVSNGSLFKRNQKHFIHNMSYGAHLSTQEIEGILTNPNCNFLSKIRLYPSYSAQRTVPHDFLQTLSVEAPLTSERVAVLDSGIDHPLLQGLVDLQYNFTKHKTKNGDHGTFVASRLLFGDGLFTKDSKGHGSVIPTVRILDVRVLYLNKKNEYDADDEEIKDAIDEILDRHQDVTIFNLSIAGRSQVRSDLIDPLTEFLDTRAREKDVIFVCAVGNHTAYIGLDSYLGIFDDKLLDTSIAAPADAINVISVGSICSSVSSEALCKDLNFPSPFTRIGGIRSDWKKPELVLNGGNVKHDPSMLYLDDFCLASRQVFGVPGLNTKGLARDIGTSFSAPLVAAQCAILLDHIKKSNVSSCLNLNKNRSNLVKALLIHSTSKVDQAKVENERLKRAYGFGIPSVDAAIADSDNQATFIYCDSVKASGKVHKMKINLPEALLNKKVKFTFTLVYNPPVDQAYPDEYQMITLEPSLKLAFKNGDLSQESPSGPPKTISLCPSHDWENYRKKAFNTVHFSKIRQNLNSLNLEVGLRMTLSDKYRPLGGEEHVEQPYAVVLTVKAEDSDMQLRSLFLATNQFEEMISNQIDIQPVTIQT
jgi:hypothetical protein